MNRTIQIILLLLAILPPAAYAYDFEVDSIYYNITNDNEASVTYKQKTAYAYLNDYRGDVTIPETVIYNGITYYITAIGYNAFRDCYALTSADIPNSVTSIGENAFSGCNALTSIVIPNSVTSIGEAAFSGCSGLTSVTIPNSVTNISICAFQGCNALTSVDIPNSVTSIDDFAFSYTGLRSVAIPNSVTSIGNAVFSYCSDLTSVTIPNSVTFFGHGTFSHCPNLTDITIPNSVTAIGESAFSNCTGLTSIDIPNSVTSIGDGAFYGCTGLSTITIPYSVSTIDHAAFYGCTGLTEITSLPMIPPTVGSYAFYSCNVSILYVPKDAVNAYRSADVWKNFTNIVGIDYVPPVSTFEMDGIYYRIKDANSVSVIANEEAEAYYAGDVVIPDTVTYEDDTYVVTSIANSAFENCYDLTSITISNTVETIGELAFQGCTGLTSVTIGSGVTSIGAKAFNYCNALETVKCMGTVPPVMASTDCFSTAAYNRATLLVPRQQIETYQAADYWYKFTHIDGWGSGGRGDVNEDGNVNISDVTSLIDYLLSGTWN